MDPIINLLKSQKSDITNYLMEYMKTERRGYGYWIWKFFIISNALESLPENAILQYVDGRSGFNGNKITWLDFFSSKMNMILQFG